MAIDLTSDQQAFLADFGESVIYTPANGAAREISVIVDRNPPTDFIAGNTPTFWVTAANDETIGIASDSMSTGADLVDIAERVGETETSRTITRVIRHDAGMVTVEAR